MVLISKIKVFNNKIINLEFLSEIAALSFIILYYCPSL